MDVGATWLVSIGRTWVYPPGPVAGLTNARDVFPGLPQRRKRENEYLQSGRVSEIGDYAARENKGETWEYFPGQINAAVCGWEFTQRGNIWNVAERSTKPMNIPRFMRNERFLAVKRVRLWALRACKITMRISRQITVSRIGECSLIFIYNTFNFNKDATNAPRCKIITLT